MSQRARWTVPFSGLYPHHEHRSKRGRNNNSGTTHKARIEKKKMLEKIKIKELETEYAEE